jgi:hypothetical protein
MFFLVTGIFRPHLPSTEFFEPRCRTYLFE